MLSFTCCKLSGYSRICCSKIGYVSRKKSIENGKKRVEDTVNGVLLCKTVSNKFIPVQNVRFNIMLSCYSISEFVALKYARFRFQKSIENERKRVEDPITDNLFSKSVSNKFITVQNVIINMVISCYSIPEFVALKYARFRVQKSIENERKSFGDPVTDNLFSKSISNKFITV